MHSKRQEQRTYNPLARITAREQVTIFLLCHYFARDNFGNESCDGKTRNACRVCYLGRSEAFNTKIGLSIGAVTVSSSLSDELPKFLGGENDRQRLDSRSRDLSDGGLDETICRGRVRPLRGFSVLLPYRDYVYLSVTIGIYSSV